MLDARSLEWRMACERLKDEAAVLERQCETILGRFADLNREPTAAERDARRDAYLENRSRLYALEGRIADLKRNLREYGR